MNPHNKSFLLGFAAGLVVMLMLAMIWNLSATPEKSESNVTINETPKENPIVKLLNEPAKNPFEGITAPDITKYVGKLIKFLLVGFVLFYIFFAVNTQSR